MNNKGAEEDEKDNSFLFAYVNFRIGVVHM